jgi:LmbE family N-acetylglucosaminyl deacetylase
MVSTDLTLLAVLAHPDDETFGTGGTLALYASRGVAVHVVCATRGEAGVVEAGMLHGHASIGDLREEELRCAGIHLGLAGVHFLGYRDSGMAGSPDNEHPQALVGAPIEDVAARVVTWIRRLRPQVIITFDPVGGYHHPDHIHIQQATVRAFHAASDPNVVSEGLAPHAPAKLYFHTFPRRSMRLALGVMRLLGRSTRVGKNRDIDLLELANDDFPIHARIDVRPVADRKRQATACHASQQMPIRGVSRVLMRFADGRETYMRAFPPAPPRLRERDLFEGIQPSVIARSRERSER